MPSTKYIYDKEYVLLNLLTKKCSCLYYAASGPLHCSLHIHRALCNIAGLLESYHKVLRRQLYCDKISSVCVKTNSGVFNCKTDNKSRNPDNL